MSSLQFQSLPIIKDINNVYLTIYNNRYSSIIAPTGTGKSLGIPIFIMYQLFNANITNQKIFISVPTRLSARTLYQTASTLIDNLQWPSIKPTIGYAVGDEISTYNNNTNIVYATSGHIKQKMLNYFGTGANPTINFFTYLIIDEFHIGSLDNTIILSLLPYMLFSPEQRVSFISATPITLSSELEVVSYKVELPALNITDIYSDQDYDKENYQLYERVVQLIQQYFRQGDILIFVSGTTVMNEIADKINTTLPRNSYKLYLVSANSDYDQDLFSPISQRKIILATNVAETSITIPDVAVVIDTLFERRYMPTRRGNYTLKTFPISKASAIQRRGRTGRTIQGIYLPLLTRNSFERLNETREEEIYSVPLFDDILKLQAKGFDCKNFFLVSKDIQTRIVEALDILTNIKALETIEGILTITDKGQFLAQLPISPRNAGIIYDGQGLISTSGLLLVATLIENYGPQSYLKLPYNPKLKREDNVKYQQEFIDRRYQKGETDLHTYMILFSQLAEVALNANNTIIDRKLNDFCKEYSLDYRKAKEVLTQLSKLLKISNLRYENDYKVNELLERLKQIMADNYSEYILTHRSKLNYVDNTGLPYSLNNREIISNLNNKPPRKLIVFDVNEISSPVSTIRVIKLAIDYPQTKQEQLISDNSIEKFVRAQGIRHTELDRSINLFLGQKLSTDLYLNPPLYLNTYDINQEQFIERILQGDIKFPFRARYITDRYQIFTNLQNLPIKFNSSDTSITITDYELVDVLPDLFCEEDRVDKVYDWYNDEKFIRTIVEQLYQQYTIINDRNLREVIREHSSEKELFYPSWIRQLIPLTLGKNITGKNCLDLSTKWGEILLVAMAVGLNYTGIEIDGSLSPKHSQMIEEFGDKQLHRVNYEGNIPSGSYDLIIARDYDKEMIKTAWEYLKKGGILIVRREKDQPEKFIDGSTYRGAIKLRPDRYALIWSK